MVNTFHVLATNPDETARVINRIGGCMGPRACPDTEVAKTKILPFSSGLYSLRYPDQLQEPYFM
jgi:hypothetical protein